MNVEAWQGFLTFGFFVALLSVAGFYCLLVTRSLIRAIIGLELLIKAATLLVIAAGYFTGMTALTQSLVVTIIVIEVVIVVVAGGIALRVFRHNDDLDIRRLNNLKG
ncbi:MAG: NADH-quinone oxidoreductase subunit K [Candidatus Omnitrophota bacterium]|nr:NADH-quinone oxidoreductase subunit K [Candidatus Omnitrophota bacterium]